MCISLSWKFAVFYTIFIVFADFDMLFHVFFIVFAIFYNFHNLIITKKIEPIIESYLTAYCLNLLKTNKKRTSFTLVPFHYFLLLFAMFVYCLQRLHLMIDFELLEFLAQ